MTRLAQRNQITPIMCATFTQRFLVMNLFHRNCKSTFKTQLTEWMLQSILITYPLPCTAITETIDKSRQATQQIEEELIDTLIAISVVAKRLAANLRQQNAENGGTENEQNE
mgnify:CR=1 FL=1